MKLANCKYCKSDDILIAQHSGLWKVRCDGNYCLVVQCCKTEKEATERWNDINK